MSLLGGGGPNVAANVQAGQTNTQTVGTTSNTSTTVKDSTVEKVDSRDTDTSSVVADDVQTVVVINDYTIPTWVLALIILGAGFLIPSPKEIYRFLTGKSKERG